MTAGAAHRLALAAALGLLSGCAGSARRAGASPDPGASPEAALYQERCGACHDAYPAHAYRPGQWPAIVSRMRGRARLSDAQAERLAAWLRGG